MTAKEDKARLSSLELALGVGSAFGALVLFGLTFVGRSFGAMFADFGSDMELPLVSRLATSTWFTIVLSLVVAALTAGGLAGRSLSMTLRRTLILVATLLSVTGAIACVFGFYLPIFSLAGRIKP